MPQLFFKKVNIKSIANERATYSICELKEFVDWEVKRVYFIQNCKEATGQHCHFVENEFFLMARGSCVAIIDRGRGREEIPLNAPDEGIVVGHHVWHGFKDFSEDAIFLALSSTNYNPDRSDYCEDYEKYLQILREGGYTVAD